MNRFKRFYLLLCFLLTFCVGFSSIGNTVAYAYEKEDNFYPLVVDDSQLYVYINNWSTFNKYTANVTDNKMKFSNPDLTNIMALVWTQSGAAASEFTFPYSPDLYDYYLIGNITAKNSDKDKSTFKPTEIQIYGQDYDTFVKELYTVSNTQIYNIDTEYYCGFGWSTKVNFQSANNLGIREIGFLFDKDTLGSKPANMIMEMGILAVDKSGSETAILSQILNQLKQMEESITENIQNGSNSVSFAVGQAGEKVSGAVNEAGDKIANKVEEQYQMDESEDFGVGDITEEVEEKLGVLTVGTDTLIGFLDLFDASNAGSTTITFPAFEIEVQGQSYNVWNDIHYDLSTLEDDFGILIDAVRTVLVLCVWLAVLSYLVKAKDHFINGGG